MIEVRRAADRFTTHGEGRTTRHSFSFGPHYDPADVGLAVLVAHNDDLVRPGHGYDTHPHADLEIVTWVLEGSLLHRDSHGHDATVPAGSVQRLSAGSGVQHAEHASGDVPGPTRFVQMWLRPDQPGAPPSYDERAVDLAPGAGLVPLASGVPGVDAAVRVHTAGAVLHVARPASGEVLVLPDAPRLHVFVARGAVDLEGAGRLEEGDAARLTGGGGTVTGETRAEVLVWQLPLL